MNKRRYFYSLPIILLLIAVAAGWFATEYLGKRARQETIRESRGDASALSIYACSTFSHFEAAVKSLAGSPSIAPALTSGRGQDMERANGTLDRYNSGMKASVTYLMDAAGMTVASSNRKDMDSFVGKSYSFRPYFQAAAKGKPGHYFAVGITSGKMGFYASCPVKNQLGKVLGVVTMKKDLDDMEDFFSQYSVSFLVSPDGIIFLSSSPSMVLKSLWPLDKITRDKLIASRQFGDELSGAALLEKDFADGTELTLEGKAYFVCREAIDSDGWLVVLLAPTSLVRIYKLIGILATVSVCLLIMSFSGIIYAMDRSGEAIRHAEESNRLLLHAAGQGILGVDTTGQVTFVNPAALRMLGFTEEEMLGQKAHALIHHSHKDGSAYPAEDCPMYASYTRAAENHAIEEWLWRKEGSSFPVEYTSMPITRDGRLVGAVVTYKDITRREHAEAILRESEERYRMAIEHSNDAVALVEGDEHIYVNQKFLDTFGYENPEDIIGKSTFTIVHPDDREMVLEYNRKRQTGEPVPSRYEFKGIKKDGTILFIEVSAAKITYRGKSVSLAYLRDMTERKHMEEQLHAMSLTDELTGLYNRRGFLALSEQQLKIAERAKKDMLFFFADLDKLKLINDILGHQEGDKAIFEIASILKEVFRESDIIGRMGGDEFAVLAINTTDETGEVLRTRLRTTVANYNRPEGRNYQLSLSIGIAHFDPETPSTLDELMVQADTLMYEEKRGKQK